MSISRKLLVAGVSAAAILAASSSAFAKTNYKGDFKGEVAAPAPAPVVADKGLMGGFYLGAGLGYDNDRATNNLVSVAGIDVVDPAKTDLSLTGVAGKIFGGYGQYFDNWYLGAEAFFGLSNADGKDGNDGVANRKISSKNSYGLSLIPGYKFTPSTLTFVRLGWTSGKYELKDTVNGIGSTSASKRLNGLTVGVGMETQVYDNWSLRGEFDHTEFRNSNVTTNLGGLQFVDKLAPKANQAMLSVIYHFAQIGKLFFQVQLEK